MWRDIIMNIEHFRAYLSKKYDNERVIGDAISRCKRVEKYEGDLDEHYSKDAGISILNKLSYSKEDSLRQIEPKHSIPIKGSKGYQSIYEGTLSIYRATELYFDYKKTLHR